MRKLMIVVGCILYFLSPVDLIPEILFLGVGYIDDLAAILLTIRAVIDGDEE